jgi:Fe-S-cluster containining protein
MFMGDFYIDMKSLFDSMEQAYDAVGKHYGFTCEGCTDNCCTQRFYHHTLAETRYLHEGLRQADTALVREIYTKALEVVASYESEQQGDEVKHLMCPINFDGLCKIYEHRPMICRMHGLPHRIKKPDGSEDRAGGCGPFTDKIKKIDWTVNRTPHYTALARIERDIRARSGFSGSYARTTAEMIVEIINSDKDLLESEE